MDENKKYSIWILILFVLGAIFTVVWGLFLNRGQLTVISKAPYTVSILSGPSQDCTEDTCTLTLKPGKKFLSIFKENHEEFQSEIDVPRWQTVELKADPRFIPKIVELGEEISIPTTKKANFTFDFDHEQGKQAVFDSTGKVISYFPRQLEESTLSVSPDESHIAVLENTGNKANVYLIDVKNLKRNEIFSEEGEVSAVKFSPHASKIIIALKKEDVTENYLYKDGKLNKLNYADSIDKFAWIDDEKFIVATGEIILNAKTASEITDQTEITFEDYFAIVSGEITEAGSSEEKTVYFHLFNTQNFATQKLSSLVGNEILPVKLDVLADGRIIFAAKNAKYYELLLQERER